VVNPETPIAREIGKIDVLPLGPGDLVRITAPAGGGHGDPLERDPAAVAQDVRAGLVTARAAGCEYGVVFLDGGVDDTATRNLRAELRGARGARRGFDVGPFRERLDQRWPPEIADACSDLLASLPIPVRDFAKHVVFNAVGKAADGRPVAVADLERAWQEVQAILHRAIYK
jgi:N-methylhydantoinase B